MKRYGVLAPLSAIAVASGLTLFAPITAYAGDQPTCDGVDMTTGDGGSCADQTGGNASGSASSSTKVVSTTVNGVDINSSTTVLAFVQAHGATHAQMQGKHYQLPYAMTLKTSWRVDRGYGWHPKSYPAGYTFVKGKDGYWHDPLCWNSVIIPIGPQHFPASYVHVTGSVKIVKRFVYKSTAKASASDHVVSTSSVWVNTYDQQGNLYCHSDASASGEAWFDTFAMATAKGRVLVKVMGAAKALAQGNLSVKLEGKTLVQVHNNTKASASGKATANAATHVHCSQAPNTQAPERPTVSIGQKNDVDVNDTATVCADYNVSGSDTATLQFGSSYGSFPTGLGGNTFTVSGSGTQCTEYMAPSEVPSSGYDTITVTLRDNQTGLSDNTPVDNSTPIRINPTPPPPA